MNVGLITEHFLPSHSGIAWSVYRIASNLARRKVKVFVIVLDYEKKDQVKPYIEREICRTNSGHDFITYRVGPNSRNVARSGMVASQKRNSVMSIEKICKKENIQIIHAFRILDPGFVGIIVAKKLGIPVIISVRGNDLSRDMFDFAKFSVISWVLRQADAVTFVTKRLLLLAQQFFDSPSYFVTIENSVDVADILEESTDKKIPLKCQFPTSSKVVGYVGEIREKKGLIYLLEAFEMLLSNYPNLHLLLVGDFTKVWERKFYMDYFVRMNLKKQITVTGRVPHFEAMKYLKKMDVFVMPSIDDGMPNALLESFALGIPAVVSDIFSPDLKNRVHALVVRRGDSWSLKKAIAQILDDKTYARGLAKNAQILVKERYSVKNEIAAYLKLYRKVIFNGYARER